MTSAPSLVVIGGDSCSKGVGFKSQHSTHTGSTFFHIHFVVKIVMAQFFLKKKKILIIFKNIQPLILLIFVPFTIKLQTETAFMLFLGFEPGPGPKDGTRRQIRCLIEYFVLFLSPPGHKCS